MEKEDKKKEIFDEIEMQINKMDNKSGLLISAVGVVFALTIDLFSIFSLEGFEKTCNCFKVFCYLFACLYLLSFSTSMFFFIASIFPRRNKKQKDRNNETIHINYYYDLSDLQRNKSFSKVDRNKIFDELLIREIKNGDNLTNQIFTNADICRKKHNNINIGIKFLIPFLISMIGLIVLLIIGI